MIAKYFFWVYLCWAGECGCERITIGSTDRELYLKTSHGEIFIEGKVYRGEFQIMKQDTTRYAVYGEHENGMIIFINHLNNNNKFDWNVMIAFDRECLPIDQ
jgi:hypothetical protein